MYPTAKCRTLAEIKITTLENKAPHGSQIKGKEILVALNENSFHEINMSLLLENR
jgi:hypothetical protein